MSIPAKQYTTTLKDIFEPFGIDLYQKTAQLALSWGQIKQLNQDPLVTIGAHTVNHYALSHLSLEEAKNEIEESKQSIEAHLHQEVRHFAYPFGGREEAGQREFDLVKAIGFKTAVTTRFAGIFLRHRFHLECLPRIFVHHGADEVFLQQVVNGTLIGKANRFKRVVTV
jgi:peptidoglycan/xylan/chitin deacetylase (PgdA/CDA1 family)